MESGLEVLLADGLPLLAGKRAGLITNHTGIDRAGRSGVDVLQAAGSVRLVALFSPEHGLRGTAAPGERVGSGTDERTGLPVYSLYGQTRKPTPAMLKDVDVLVYDLQEVGGRTWTYAVDSAEVAASKRMLSASEWSSP